MNIGLMIVSNFRLHIPHILSIFINTLIGRSHINLIFSHLIGVLPSNDLCFRNWLLISRRGDPNWNWYVLIVLSFILFTFFIWVKMNMYIVWIVVFIIFIVSIMIWPTASWKISSWVVIRVSIRHHRRACVNINNIIRCTNINSVMMSIFGYLRNWNVFWNIFSVYIYYINNILSMLCDLFRIVNFVRILNIEWITNVRIYKFASIVENIIPIIIIFKLLSKHILYLSTILRVTIKNP